MCCMGAQPGINRIKRADMNTTGYVMVYFKKSKYGVATYKGKKQEIKYKNNRTI